MDAACYATADYTLQNTNLAMQQLVGGFLMPVTQKTNFKFENRQENPTLLNNHDLTVHKEGRDGCSLLCYC